MTFEELQVAISKDQVDTANDINRYLGDTSVPMECYQRDIDAKLMDSVDRIVQLLTNYAKETLQG